MKMRFAIIGAGMAGLACADVLVSNGHEVSVFDKGRGPGGRMSTKRIESEHGVVCFDHGAQYFTARDHAFRVLVAEWQSKSLVAPWPILGPDVWIGVPGMSAVIGHMAAQHDVRFDCLVKGLVRDAVGWSVASAQGTFGPFDGVIIALPAEQAAPLLALQDLTMAQTALFAKSQPCWTAMLGFDQKVGPKADFIRDAGIISWAARNSAKPGREGLEAWVVQATPGWSATNLEQAADEIIDHLVTALSDAFASNLPAPLLARAHRWRFALSAGIGIGSIWNAKIGLGLCGDWLLGPRVECAWMSGTELGSKIGGQRVMPTLTIRIKAAG